MSEEAKKKKQQEEQTEIELDGVEEDDPTQPDEDEMAPLFDVKELATRMGVELPDEPDEDNDKDDLGDEEIEEEEPVEEGEEELEEEPEGEEEEPESSEEKKEDPPPGEKLLPQSQVNEIVQGRLAKDALRSRAKELESLMGKPIDKILEETRQGLIQDTADEYGVSEERAQEIIAAEEKVRFLEQEQRRIQEEQQAIQAQQQYAAAKAKFANNPLAKKYESEIDNFTQNGTALDYEAGMAFILGQKVLSGELTKSIQDAAEKKTIANVQKRKKAGVESGSRGAAGGPTLPREQVQMARALGLSQKDLANQIKEIEKSKRRR